MPERGVSTKEWIDELHSHVPWLVEENVANAKANNVTWFRPHAKALVKLCNEHDVSVPEHAVQFMDTVVLNAPSRRDIIDCLRRISVASFSEVKKAHLQTVRETAATRDAVGEQTRTALRAFAQRISTIRPGVIVDGDNDDERALSMFKEVINFGIENAAVVSYSYFDVIPDTYFAHCGKDPSPEEYLEIARSVLSTMMHIATSHDSIFNAINHVMRRGPVAPQKPKGDFFWPPFHAEDFALQGSTLALNEQCIALIKEWIAELLAHKKIKLHEPRMGCAGLELFPVIFQCCLEAAKHSLFRHAERIRSLPREIGSTPAFRIGQVPHKSSSAAM